jgi:mono/diheme cytochrome c family protein
MDMKSRLQFPMARLRPLLMTAGLAARLGAGADFGRDVLPVFEKRCQACHGPATQSSGLRLDGPEAVTKGGYSGPVVVPGNAAQSRLYRLIAGLDAKVSMPPAGPRLTSAEIAAVKEWIESGAAWTAAVRANEPARPVHWAFVAPKRPEEPRIRNRAQVRNPIDAFVLRKLEERGMAPSPEADPATLVRRLHLDLIGLPPGASAVERYLADRDPDRYENLVEEILRSPHFGEKWARSWLDLSRYADTEGNESDFPRPYAWRYRHWLIEAFNRDMPFDEFTVRQIAGDLMPGSTVEHRAGLGFFRNTLSNREGGADIEAERVEQVVDRTNSVGLAWLGLTVGCARCHDHKYDPISQRDYYRLYAFFNNADEVNIDAPLPGESGDWLRRRPEYERKRAELLNPVAADVAGLQQTWEDKIRWAASNPGKDHVWDRQLELLGLQWEQGYGGGQLEGLTVLYLPPERRTKRQRDHMQEMFLGRGSPVSPEAWKKLGLAELSKKLTALNKEYPPMTQAPSMTERADRRRDNFIHLRGDFRSRGIAVEENTPSALPRLPSGAQRNRLALAQWLVSAGHPLTARVTVNRVWQDLFGRGIVATPDDFGTQGARPSHPELLDWLAVDFREGNWGFKRLLRTVVNSATYRQASARRKELDAADPTNSLLARQSRFRIPAESVRDSALFVSGLLNPAIGGPSVRPPQPAGVTSESLYADWVESTGPDRYRRGLYTKMQRTAPYPQLLAFDAPDPNLMCARRERSNSPLQALTLLNDPVFVEAARALARRVLLESPNDTRARVDRAFRLCYGRPPSAGELDRTSSYLERETARLSRLPSNAGALAPAYLDGIENSVSAAWSMLASGLMNTDEFFTRE